MMAATAKAVPNTRSVLAVSSVPEVLGATAAAAELLAVVAVVVAVVFGTGFQAGASL